MPLPTPNQGEDSKGFFSRCMSALKGEYPNEKQRAAICHKQAGTSKRLVGQILSKNEEQRLVFGWASIIERDGNPIIDKQGDVIEEAELEKAFYDFVLHSRLGGDMHEKAAGRLVECMVFTRAKQELMGIDLGFIGAWVGVKVDREETWERVKAGELKSFSIAGTADGEEVNIAAA